MPAALVAPILAGRLSRLTGPRALRLGYAAQGVTSIVVALAVLVDAHVVIICVLAALSSCAVTCTRPVHNALLPEISDTTSELTAGNAGSGSMEAAATFLGPLASAVLLQVWVPGGVVLVIDAKSDSVAKWYASCGAMPLNDAPLTLLLPLATIAQALS